MVRLINRHPGRVNRIWLATLPFVCLLLAYLAGSEIRLAENPSDKLLPGLTTLGEAVDRLTTEPSRRSGEILLWADTLSSLTRLLLGLGLATLFAASIGVLTGLLPYLRASLGPLVTALSMVPPLAVLPILFIIFGLGEVSKVVLIVIGITPFMIRDLILRTTELPAEQLIKAQSLGADTLQILVRVVLPQMMPRLIDALRLSLGPAWLFLISAEAIASTDGLGYRIFLVRRYLAMETIIPYVLWITFLAFMMDWLLSKLRARAFPWVNPGAGPGAGSGGQT